MRWTKPSGMATVAVVSALLAVAGEIMASSTSAASVSESAAFAPMDDPAPDCTNDPGNPACPPGDPNPPRHHHGGSPNIVGPPLAPFNMPPSIGR